MPDSGKKKTKVTKTKVTKKKGTSSNKKGLRWDTQRKRDTRSRASSAKRRHDINMRATGRKRLATNYGTKSGDKKR